MAEQQSESKTPTVTPAATQQTGLARAPTQQRAFSPRVQLKRGLQMMSFDEQASLLSLGPVQRDGGAGGVGTEQVHAAAAHGIASGGGAMPHGQQIQEAFGGHDISGIQAHTGSAATQANQAMGAEAYATGNHIAFGGAPDLHTAAHEAAHVIQQEHGVSLSGGVGQTGDAYEQHADQVADAVVKGESAEPILNSMAGGAPKSGTQQKATQQRAVQLSPVQRTGPPPPPAPVAPTTTRPAVPANSEQQISRMREKLQAAKTGAATATTLEAVQAVARDAMQARVDAEGLASRDSANTDYPTARDEADALYRAASAGDGFVRRQEHFTNSRTSNEAQGHLDAATGRLDQAKTLMGGLAAAGATWVAAAGPKIATLKTAEEKIAAFEQLVGAAVDNRTTIGTAYTTADAALMTTGIFQNAFNDLNGKHCAALVSAKTALKAAVDAKLALVQSGAVAPELSADDGALIPVVLMALEQFGEPVNPNKESAGKLTRAAPARDAINAYGEAAPDRGESIRTWIDGIEPKITPAEVGVFAPWLANHLRSTTQSKIEPKLIETLRLSLMNMPDGCEASAATENSVSAVERFLTEADAEAAKGRITLSAAPERARLAQAKECKATNDEYAALLPLEQLESEKEEEAKVDEPKFRERLTGARQVFTDKLKEIGGGIKAFGRWVWGLVTRKETVTAQEKDALKLEMVQGAGALTSLLSTGGWAEALLEAVFTLLPPSVRSTEEDREGRQNQNMIAVGQGIQVGGNVFKATGGELVGRIAGAPVDVAQAGISLGKFLQKKGEGYNALEAAMFALSEYFNGPVLGMIPIIGPFLDATGALQSGADAVGGALATLELDISNRMLLRDEETLITYQRKLNELEQKWTVQKFKPIPEFDTRYEDTNKRVLEVLEKKRVIDVRRVAATTTS